MVQNLIVTGSNLQKGLIFIPQFPFPMIDSEKAMESEISLDVEYFWTLICITVVIQIVS